MEWEKYLYGFSRGQIFFAIALVAYLFYLVNITEPVPNLNNEIQTFLDENNYKVVEQNITNNHILLGLFLIVGFVTSFLATETKKGNRLSIEEARDILDDYLSKRKMIKTETGDLISIGKYNIDENFITRYSSRKEESKAFRYVLQITITDLSDIEHYVKAYIHPYTKYIDGILRMDAPLGENDQCPTCGKEYDIKYIDTEEVRTLKHIKEEDMRVGT